MRSTASGEGDGISLCGRVLQCDGGCDTTLYGGGDIASDGGDGTASYGAEACYDVPVVDCVSCC